jgi:farnesyl-diphosphate farnesyltransferase
MNPLLWELLEQTSRSFYRTLRVLPGRVREQISLAYLLARTTDTIADTEVVAAEQRLRALADLRARILGQRTEALNFADLARRQGAPAERGLLEQCELAIARLRDFSREDVELIRRVLDTITSGQELDLLRFTGASTENIVALETRADLDDYTYRVAGCVGEFWTRLCRAHLFPRARLDDARLLADGVRFGQGLQLVNILRDLPADLRQGRCYLPAAELRAAGLQPRDLLAAAEEARLRPVYDPLLALAEAHLAAGWRYTNTLPWRCARVRLACAWPVLIGVQTLARLRVQNPLDATQRIKITRALVRGILWRTVVLYPFPGLWRSQATLAE